MISVGVIVVNSEFRVRCLLRLDSVNGSMSSVMSSYFVFCGRRRFSIVMVVVSMNMMIVCIGSLWFLNERHVSDCTTV